MKNLNHFSPHQRERRHSFCEAIDLLLHWALSLAAIVLTVIAFVMAIEAIWPTGLLRMIGL